MNTTRHAQTDHGVTNRSAPWRRPALVAASVTLLASSCGIGSLDPTADAATVKPLSAVMAPVDATVSIDMSIDNPYSLPLGSFEVTEGADVLGCSAGRFIDTEHDDGSHTSVLACLEGDRSGTFEVEFQPHATVYTATPDQPEHFAGPWTISAGTGDFLRLGGGGDLVGSELFPVLTYDTTLGGRVDFNK